MILIDLECGDGSNIVFKVFKGFLTCITKTIYLRNYFLVVDIAEVHHKICANYTYNFLL